MYEAGLVYFDGTDWTLQTPHNSLLPHENVAPIVIDSKGNKWLGTISALGAGGGLVKYDGTNYTLFDQTNSGLPGKKVYSLAIDSHENLWIGTETGGLAVFREGGVILEPPTAIEDEANAIIPTSFSLAQNFPNPFNSGTVIRINLPQSEVVELAVFNLAGQQVATLVEGRREPGVYSVNWDGRDGEGRELASGVYLYRLRTGDGQQVETRKLVLMK